MRHSGLLGVLVLLCSGWCTTASERPPKAYRCALDLSPIRCCLLVRVISLLQCCFCRSVTLSLATHAHPPLAHSAAHCTAAAVLSNRVPSRRACSPPVCRDRVKTVSLLGGTQKLEAIQKGIAEAYAMHTNLNQTQRLREQTQITKNDQESSFVVSPGVTCNSSDFCTYCHDPGINCCGCWISCEEQCDKVGPITQECCDCWHKFERIYGNCSMDSAVHVAG